MCWTAPSWRAHIGGTPRCAETLQEIQGLWEAHGADPANIATAGCRRVQDAAYLLRRDGPKIPGAFYRLRREAAEHGTVEGVVLLLGGAEPFWAWHAAGVSVEPIVLVVGDEEPLAERAIGGVVASVRAADPEAEVIDLAPGGLEPGRISS